MSEKAQKSVTSKVIAQSNRMTAKTIYVPSALRPHVTVKSTSSGTRLSGKK